MNNPIAGKDTYQINSMEVLSDCYEKYEGYFPTSRIFVLIYAPSWNTDPHKIDIIGTDAEHPITAHTSVSQRNLVGTDTDFVLDEDIMCV